MNRLLVVIALLAIFNQILCNEITACDVKEIFVLKQICERDVNDPIYILYSGKKNNQLKTGLSFPVSYCDFSVFNEDENHCGSLSCHSLDLYRQKKL